MAAERNEMLDAFLDECYPPLEISGIYQGVRFYPSDVIYNCDPIMYRELMLDFQNSCRHEFDEDSDTCGLCEVEKGDI